MYKTRAYTAAYANILLEKSKLSKFAKVHLRRSCLYVCVCACVVRGGELCHVILRGGGAPSQRTDALSDSPLEEQHTCEKLAFLRDKKKKYVQD